jgi:hypothetical protein
MNVVWQAFYGRKGDPLFVERTALEYPVRRATLATTGVMPVRGASLFWCGLRRGGSAETRSTARSDGRPDVKRAQSPASLFDVLARAVDQSAAVRGHLAPSAAHLRPTRQDKDAFYESVIRQNRDGRGDWLVRGGGRDDCLPRDMVTPEPRRESPPPARPDTVSRGTAWAVGLFAALVLFATTVASMGLAAFVWVPLLAMIGGVMCTVWAARRRRQTQEGRSASDVKDSLHTTRPWPTKGITDDRLLP